MQSWWPTCFVLCAWLQSVPMQTRILGNSDLELTPVGFGTWAIGGDDWGMGWGPQDEADSVSAILEGLESGINWIDTAHAYGFGVAEEVVGKALKEWPEPVIIATKCGVLPNADRTPPPHSPNPISGRVDDVSPTPSHAAGDLLPLH